MLCFVRAIRLRAARSVARLSPTSRNPPSGAQWPSGRPVPEEVHEEFTHLVQVHLIHVDGHRHRMVGLGGADGRRWLSAARRHQVRIRVD